MTRPISVPAPMGDLVRVVAPHFVAGLIVHGERVVHAAPILRWTIGKQRDFLRGYFARKGWQATVLRARRITKGRRK